MTSKFVDKNNSVLCTDEFTGYKPFERNGYKHFTVNHSQGEYSNNGIHTNTIEGFWGLLRRGITGQYHWLSNKYLNHYINEFCFKYNNRKNDSIFEELVGRMLGVFENKVKNGLLMIVGN